MAINNTIGITPHSPNTSAKTIDNISSGINGDEIPPVFKISEIIVVVSNKYRINDGTKKRFLGCQKYEITDVSAMTPANIIEMLSIDIVKFSRFKDEARYGQKYKTMMALATKKVASQIRRCQKLFSAIGFIVAP